LYQQIDLFGVSLRARNQLANIFKTRTVGLCRQLAEIDALHHGVASVGLQVVGRDLSRERSVAVLQRFVRRLLIKP